VTAAARERLLEFALRVLSLQLGTKRKVEDEIADLSPFRKEIGCLQVGSDAVRGGVAGSSGDGPA
jgi:hypothetical protein